LERALVGRQPIYRNGLEVFAYELLHRSSDLNEAAFVNGDSATAQVLLNAFLEIGLDRVVGSNLAFVNIPRNFLLSEYCSSLPKDRVVLEILEDSVPDKPLISSVTKLSRSGYQIALDDFIYSEPFRPLLELTNIAKIDIQAQTRVSVAKHIDALRHYDLKILAEKVETHEEFEFCRKLGFDYYQGYFFCKPNVVSGEKIPFNRLAALRLVAKLQDPGATIAEIEQTVGQDLAVSYKLLRYVNSATNAVKRQIESIRHAVTLIGTKRIRNWATLIMFADMDEKPRELMITAIVRARMCEQLGLAMRQQNVEQFFTVGLFSVLDALLDHPMAQALELLPLAEEVHNGILDHAGLMGSALHCVLAYERSDWNEVVCRNLNHEEIRDAYLNSVEWTRSMMRDLGI
jgi:EAL and modified HD-GYP domain-containing signal transduction protein